ncbi:MAG: DNA primase [Rhodobacteraceae bacterium]|nr:DNA primase [Paracoccaceae bacterium]
MSLPNGFIDELRNRVSLSHVVGRKVSWDQRKSNPGKGDYWAPCPFHQEKTASFHLDDRKGFYYCFGCHAKGDALSFIRETENVSFMEAVEILAREAGMSLPAPNPEARKTADQQGQLAKIMEMAVQFYRLNLNTAAAADARDYLTRRGLSNETQALFELGFATSERAALVQHLDAKGIAPELIVNAGLAIKPDDGGALFDRFRGRIMFPIRDLRGRAVAFGGRAMDPNARAKYLNSNETLLFDKGRSLYNAAPAREAAGRAGSLIVVEGYMDVIALAEAGFANVVAPLGTAITEQQLMLMWRLAPEPVIALDGDKAGLKAAMRLIDVALPLLEAGRSLRFALLPEGLDPDDLIRTRGRAAMQSLLDQARPMVDLLWQREIDSRSFDSPERRATLDASLKAVLGKIRDRSIHDHYVAAIRELRRDLFAPKGRNRDSGFSFRQPWPGRKPPVLPAENTRASLLVRAADDGEMRRETAVLALCLSYPDIVADFETALEKLHFGAEEHRLLRNALIRLAPMVGQDAVALKEKISSEIGPGTVEKLLALGHVRILPAILKPVDPATARMALAEELAKLEANRGSAAEMSDAERDMTGLVDEGLTWRLFESVRAREIANRATLPAGGTESEDREKMSKYLQNFIDSQGWVKKKH